MLNRLIGDKTNAKHVVTLLTGSVLAQGITFLVSPVLTRLFTPTDFGILAAFTAITSFIAFISSFRYEMAIMLPESDDEANKILQLSIRIVVVVSIISTVFLLLFGSQLCHWLNVPELNTYVLLMPVAILLTGLYQVFINWNTRFKSYKKISASRLSLSGSTAITNVSLGLIKFGSVSLIIGQLIGLVFGVLNLIYKWKKQAGQSFFGAKSTELKSVAKQYKDFPLYNTPHILSNQLQNNGVIFVVSILFGSVILGLYSLTMRILHAPLNLFGASFTQVFYRNASEMHSKDGDLKAYTKRSVLQLFLLSLPMFILLILFAPVLFAFVFGEEWRAAGEYAQYLAPWLLITFIMKPISTIPAIVDEQKKGFLINLIGNSLILIAIIIGGLLIGDIKTTFMILSVSQVLYQSFFIYWLISITEK